MASYRGYRSCNAINVRHTCLMSGAETSSSRPLQQFTLERPPAIKSANAGKVPRGECPYTGGTLRYVFEFTRKYFRDDLEKEMCVKQKIHNREPGFLRIWLQWTEIAGSERDLQRAAGTLHGATDRLWQN